MRNPVLAGLEVSAIQSCLLAHTRSASRGQQSQPWQDMGAGHRCSLIVLTGEVPSPINPPPGCRFRPRCPFVKPERAQVEPDLKAAASDRKVACHLY